MTDELTYTLLCDKTLLFESQQVRAILGPQSYLLREYEELWRKDLPPEVEKLLR